MLKKFMMSFKLIIGWTIVEVPNRVHMSMLKKFMMRLIIGWTIVEVPNRGAEVPWRCRGAAALDSQTADWFARPLVPGSCQWTLCPEVCFQVCPGLGRALPGHGIGQAQPGRPWLSNHDDLKFRPVEDCLRVQSNPTLF
jgi:hypothetical protein